MDAFINFLIEWGYAGMFLSALLAGSAVPFSSEAVLVALLHPSTGLNPVFAVLCAAVGNTLGSLTCYWLGRLGKTEWLVKYFRMKEEKILRAQAFLNGKGALMAFFTFLPFVGELTSVALGFMRSNIYIVTISMFVGKLLRYAVIAYIAIETYKAIA